MVVNFSKVGAENRPNTFPDLQDTAPVKCTVNTTQLSWFQYLPVQQIRKYIFKGFIFHCYVGLPECRLISSPNKNQQTTPKICWSLGIQSPPENSNGTSILCWGDSTSQSLADNMTGCLGDGNLTVSSLAPRFSSTRLFPEKSNMRCAKWAKKKQL